MPLAPTSSSCSPKLPSVASNAVPVPGVPQELKKYSAAATLLQRSSTSAVNSIMLHTLSKYVISVTGPVSSSFSLCSPVSTH